MNQAHLDITISLLPICLFKYHLAILLWSNQQNWHPILMYLSVCCAGCFAVIIQMAVYNRPKWNSIDSICDLISRWGTMEPELYPPLTSIIWLCPPWNTCNLPTKKIMSQRPERLYSHFSWVFPVPLLGNRLFSSPLYIPVSGYANCITHTSLKNSSA